MTDTEISLNSNTNSATTGMKQDSAGNVHLDETHEKDSPLDNKIGPHLKRNTPILFSTNRGLHLRMASTTIASTPPTESITSTNNRNISITKSTYSMTFCDLERWSTNRANTISLDDTFSVPKPTIATDSLVCNSLRPLPRKSTSVHFKGYSRFDVE